MKKAMAINVMLSLVLSVCGPTRADMVYVATDGNDTTGNGSFEEPYRTIQRGLGIAISGDQVILKSGVYNGPGNQDVDFLGKAVTVRSLNPYDPCVVSATIIDCNGDPNNQHRAFFFWSGEDRNSVVKGLTITNGWCHDGGGVFCRSSSPTITNCRFNYNASDSSGGGMYVRDFSNPMVTNCAFIGNSALRGGGIYHTLFSNPIVTN
jgi:predicted outer membrane repeat protein